MVSGDARGRLFAYTLHDGAFFASYSPAVPCISMDLCTVAPASRIVVAHSRQDGRLMSFTLCGQRLADVACSDRLNFLYVCAYLDMEVLVTGGERGEIVVRHLHSLRPLRKITHTRGRGDLLCATMSGDKRYLFVGTGDGSLVVITTKF